MQSNLRDKKTKGNTSLVIPSFNKLRNRLKEGKQIKLRTQDSSKTISQGSFSPEVQYFKEIFSPDYEETELQFDSDDDSEEEIEVKTKKIPQKHEKKVDDVSNDLQILEDMIISNVSNQVSSCQIASTSTRYISDSNLSSLNLYEGDNSYETYVINTLRIIKKMAVFMNSKEYYELLEGVKSKITYDFSKDNIPWLILDLDETLIHSINLSKREFCTDHDNKILDIKILDINYGIYIRPYVKKFLDYAIKNFKLCLFTASGDLYASEIIKAVGISDYFSLVLTREHCIKISEKFYLKDLSIFPNLESVLIVENNLLSFAKHLSNGILLNSYCCDKSDTELFELIDYLEELRSKVAPEILVESTTSVNTLEKDSSFDSINSALKEVRMSLAEANEEHFYFANILKNL